MSRVNLNDIDLYEDYEDLAEETPEDLGFDCDLQNEVTDEDRAILEKARLDGDWDFYSDYYKDCYGVRPRF